MLHELTKSPWRSKPGKKLGRWNSSGAWNYSGKWIKGQKSRSWWSVPAWFEWWQTPLYRRLPKLRWFKRYFKLLEHHEPVNVGLLESDDRIKSWDTITKELLAQFWYIRKKDNRVKILGNWDLKKKLSFDGLDAISSSALTKVEAVGGTFSGWAPVTEKWAESTEQEHEEQSEE